MFGMLNVRRLKNPEKLLEIRGTFSDVSNTCTLFVETFLDTSFPDSLLDFPDKQIFRHDRSGKHGGGLIYVVSKTIDCTKDHEF